MLTGYKCFDKGLINRYGQKFEVGKVYHCSKDIKFGNIGHGFHICKNLEDTLRYFDAMKGEIDICLVECFGKYHEYEDDYYGYYDMFAFENIIIKKVLTREEIIEYALNLPAFKVVRFISLFKLTPEEIILFKNKYQKDHDVINTIAYYQEGDLNAFNKNQVKYVKKREL